MKSKIKIAIPTIYFYYILKVLVGLCKHCGQEVKCIQRGGGGVFHKNISYNRSDRKIMVDDSKPQAIVSNFPIFQTKEMF